VFERSIREHNVFAASRVYHNVGLEALGTLLDVKPEEAERLVADMVVSGRLHATIDQDAGLVEFERSAGAGGAAATVAEGMEALADWDAQLTGSFLALGAAVEAVREAHPALAAAAAEADAGAGGVGGARGRGPPVSA